MDEVEKLIQDLKSKNVSVRRNAANALGKIGKPAVPALVEALGDADYAMRRSAAEALVNIGMPAVPALIEVLGNKDSNERWRVVWALGEIGIALLEDETSRQSQNFLEFCSTAVPVLVKAYGDEDYDVRGHAAMAPGIILIGRESAEALESLEEGAKEGFAALKKECHDKDKLIRVKMGVARWMGLCSEEKNKLASKRDILLDTKPKPPKRGSIYHAARRARNG